MSEELEIKCPYCDTYQMDLEMYNDMEVNDEEEIDCESCGETISVFKINSDEYRLCKFN